MIPDATPIRLSTKQLGNILLESKPPKHVDRMLPAMAPKIGDVIAVVPKRTFAFCSYTPSTFII